MTSLKLKGKQGEQLAKNLLQNKGYKFITQNYSCRLGEIDLIFKDQEALIFVEVKTRWKLSYGLPQESISSRKLKNIIKACQYFLKTHPQFKANFRIDAVAVDLTQEQPKLTHFKNITL